MNTTKKLSLLVAFMLVLGGIWYVIKPFTGVDAYNVVEDRAQLAKIFTKNWALLFNDAPFNQHTLDERLLYQRSGAYDGGPFPITFKVYREQGNVAGAVGYFMKDSYEPGVGFILFLVVDESARGKGYAEELIKAAVTDLRLRGARVVKLITALRNTRAQKFYNKVGFTETGRDSSVVYYEMAT